ncbi:MAG: hypothetical protein J6A83_00400 [Clostridia bacterium]|nr:hypothetical protein [Clostridia bacterium]
MKNVADIDKNFKIENRVVKEDTVFYSIESAPFRIYGVYLDDGKYRRLPADVARSVSDGVFNLHTHTAGGRVRFKTDSSYIIISAKMGARGEMSHFALSGSAGFDLYVKNESGYGYVNSFIPPFSAKGGYDGIINLGGNELRDITINFPLYSEVSALYIGLSDKAVLEKADDYAIEKPIVYYGSSITQGGCASRPGTCYPSLISRRFDCNYINLGFSGNARGEREIEAYIKSLDMSVFVYDYDYNAPTTAHLAATHERMFRGIREAHPDIPIIMLSRPKYNLTESEAENRAVIENTYNNALSAGDKNVYFISGRELMAVAQNEGTVDNCHPTDLGFFSMARALGELMEKIIDKGDIRR